MTYTLFQSLVSLTYLPCTCKSQCMSELFLVYDLNFLNTTQDYRTGRRTTLRSEFTTNRKITGDKFLGKFPLKARVRKSFVDPHLLSVHLFKSNFMVETSKKLFLLSYNFNESYLLLPTAVRANVVKKK